MKNIFPKLIQNTFLLNSLKVSGGAFIGLVLQLVFTPIISRIYSPENYAVLTLFNLITTNLFLVSVTAYDEALIHTKDDDEFYILSSFIFRKLFIIGVISFFTVFLFGEFLIRFFFDAQFGSEALYLIPVFILIRGGVSVLNIYMVKKGSFSRLSVSNVINNLSSRVSSIVFGEFFGVKNLGLIFGFIIGQLIFIVLGNKGIPWKRLFKFKNKAELIKIKGRFKKYPRFIFPSTWMNQFSNQIPMWCIIYFFSKTDLGVYSMAMSLLALPNTIIGNAVRPVFYKNAIDTYDKNELNGLQILTLNVLKKIFWLSVIPFAVLFFYSTEIFTFFLGAKWAKAGMVSSLLSIPILLQLISAPLAPIRRILGCENKVFRINVLLLLLRFLAFIPVYLFKLSFNEAILFYGCFSAFFYLINLIDILLICKLKIVKTISHILVIIFFVFGLVSIFKFF